jgi:hypothetical protein
MLKRIVLAGLLGGLVYFIWGALSWMVFPWHNATLNKLPNEDTVMAALREQVSESGAYFFPGMPESGGDAAAQEAYTARHRQGPLGFLLYHAGGKELAMGPAMGRGFAIDVIAALMVAFLLSMKAPAPYMCRVIFVLLIGLFSAITTHAMYWNWMLFPTDYTLAMFADVVGGWTLAGLVMAALVKPAAAVPSP